MTTFLTQCPWVSEFQYKWGLPVALRSIMMADITRVDYKKRKKGTEKGHEEETKEGTLSDFLRGK